MFPMDGMLQGPPSKNPTMQCMSYQTCLLDDSYKAVNAMTLQIQTQVPLNIIITQLP